MGGVAVMIVILAAVMVPAACIRAAGVSQGGNRQDEKQDQGEKRKQTLSFHTKHKYPSFVFLFRREYRNTISEILQFVKLR